jgi:tetratricopeptide (TPR) repeat protein
VWAQNGDVLGSLQLTATGQAAALWYDWLMPQRKNAQAKTPVKPSHRHVRAGFARLRENRYAEAKKAFQRALTLAQGTDELDGEDVARIEHLIGLCLRELGHLSAARAHFARALEQAEMFYGANHRALIPICVDLGDAMGAAGDLREAKALYERAVAIDPEAPTVASTLCDALPAWEGSWNIWATGEGRKHGMSKPSPWPKPRMDPRGMHWRWRACTSATSCCCWRTGRAALAI